MADERHVKMQAHFEDKWRHGPPNPYKAGGAAGDPWGLESSEFEQAKYAHQLAMIEGRRYERLLEIGCGAGWFTRLLAPLSDHVVALDISETAIVRAKERALEGVDFRAANVMQFDVRREGPWDLVVLSETIACLGWLYSFFEVSWLAAEIFGGTRPGGRLLMANTCGGVKSELLSPWIIRTYHDLMLNVGYRREAEETFRGGDRPDVQIDVLISLFIKQPEKATVSE